MTEIGQIIGCGALVAIFTLFMTENERVSRACVGYLKACALVMTGVLLLLLVSSK
jgi:hypothetical protein